MNELCGVERAPRRRDKNSRKFRSFFSRYFMALAHVKLLWEQNSFTFNFFYWIFHNFEFFLSDFPWARPGVFSPTFSSIFLFFFTEFSQNFIFKSFAVHCNALDSFLAHRRLIRNFPSLCASQKSKKSHTLPIRHLLRQKFRFKLKIVLIVNEFECRACFFFLQFQFFSFNM